MSAKGVRREKAAGQCLRFSRGVVACGEVVTLAADVRRAPLDPRLPQLQAYRFIRAACGDVLSGEKAHIRHSPGRLPGLLVCEGPERKESLNKNAHLTRPPTSRPE